MFEHAVMPVLALKGTIAETAFLKMTGEMRQSLHALPLTTVDVVLDGRDP